MRLLLNSHIASAVAQDLRRAGMDALALSEWLEGNYRNATDDLLLASALSDQRVLVTYDCRTIPPLLKMLAESGGHHAGVVLVDELTLRQRDIGALVRAIEKLALETGDEDWKDRVVFLIRHQSA